MSKATDMVDRLRQSVAEIMGSDASDKEDLLKKSFDEFAEALEDVQDEPGEFDEVEDDDIDPVVTYADALATADDIAAALIGEGLVDEGTAAILDHWADVSDIALRAIANSRAVPVEEEEDLEAIKADGLGLHEMPLAKSDRALLIKTDLPERVAQFVTDPEELEERIIALLDNGGGPLTKMDAGLANQLQVMMRLNAAALVQGETIMQALAGGAPPQEGGGFDDAGEELPEGEEGYGDEEGYEEEEDPEAQFAAEEEAEGESPEEHAEETPEDEAEEPEHRARKAHEAEGLRKAEQADALQKAIAAATAPLQKQLAETKSALDAMKARPSAPPVLKGFSKAEDNGGSVEDPLKKIAELPEDQRTTALMKLAHSMPINVPI